MAPSSSQPLEDTNRTSRVRSGKWRLWLLSATLFCASGAAPAWAWGAQGHRLIAVAAIRALPPTLPAFLRSPAAIWNVGELAREPDRWRRAGTTHDEELNPGHFVNIDDNGKIVSLFSLSALPPLRKDYDTTLRAGGATQYSAGYLPYSIIIGFEQLRMDFGYWRVDLAGEKHTKNSKTRAWFAADRKLREMATMRDLGVWAHFVGDASQPMHVSVHHDGWGNYPNPENLTAGVGLHAKFEGTFVHANFREADVAARMPAARDCSCKIEGETVAYLGRSYEKVLPLYRLDKKDAFDGSDAEGKAFAGERLAAGAAELRDLIAEAWRQSGTITVGYPEVAVKDAEAGRVEALGPLQGLD